MSQLGRVEIVPYSDFVLARLEGEIDISNATDLEAELAAGVPNDALACVIDLSEVGYLDSAGVRLLLSLARRLRTRGQRLHIVAPDAALITDVLLLTDVGAVAPLHATLQEAAAEIGTVVSDDGIDAKYLGTNAYLIAPVGDLDFQTAPDLADELVDVTEQRGRQAIVDLTRVTFIDSTGLSALVRGLEALRLEGGELVLVTSDPMFLNLFEMTGLHELLTILGSLDEAIAYISSDRPTGRGPGEANDEAAARALRGDGRRPVTRPNATRGGGGTVRSRGGARRP